ncbi:putative ribonuclease H-like domain-containing protein [Tanacetum coccineum]
MELENSQNNALAKLPMLKLREYEMWEIRIKQYFQIQDYALWEVIENGNSWVPIPVTAPESGPSTALKMTVPSTAEEKICKKNDVKARSLLLMALPNEHQLTFNQYVDAQSMFAAIKARFGGNEATKKTQKALLKQQYENFNASSSESLDSIFNRLQKLVSRLAILGVVTPPEDLNVKFLRSLPSEWDTHVVNTASTEISTASFSDATVYAFLSTQPQGSQLVHEDLEQLHDDDLEEMDLKWNMALLSMRARKFYQRTGRKIIIDGSSTAGYDKSKVECFNCHKIGHFARECRAPRSKDNRNWNQGSSSKAVRIEDASEKAMCAIDGAGFDWSDMAEEEIQANMALMAFSDSEVTNDKSCSKSCLQNYEALKKQYDDLLVKLDDTSFKASTYKRGLSILEGKILKYKESEVLFSEEIALLKRSVGHKEYLMGLLRTELEKVKEEKEGFEFKIAKFEKSSKDLDQLLASLEEFKQPETDSSSVKSPLKVDKDWKEKFFCPANQVREEEPKKARENNDAPIIEDWVSDDEDDVEPIPKVEKKTVIPTATKKEFVKPETPVRRSVSCPNVHKHMAPRAVLMKTGLKTVNTARPVNTVRSVNTGRPFSTARSFNTVRPSYTAHPKSTVHCARPRTYFQNQAQSTVHRPFYKRTALTKRSYNQNVNTGRQNVNTVRARGFNAVKPSACWVWKPIKPNGASLSNSQLNDKGFVDSGCSRHMTGNIAHLSDFKDFDGGYVTFGGGAHGGRITGTCTIKTGNLDFDDVYFVKELKFNLFSVSQMCDKKNYVLFTDSECLVLSPNFKLPDANQILLKIPRQDNMYSFDMKNIVPKDSLTCLVAKATSEESMLWHRRLALKKQYDDFLVKLDDTGFKAASTLEGQIIKYKEHEVLFSEEIALLKRSVGNKEYHLGLLRTELEKVKQEKEGFEFKIAKFEKSAKDLDQLLASQITDKSKKGFGYNVVPSPHPLILNRPTPLDLSYSGLEEFKQPEVNEYGPRDSSLKPTTGCDKESDNSKENTDDSLEQHTKTSSVKEVEPKKARENNDAPIIENWVLDDEDEVEPIPKVEKKTVIPTAIKKEFLNPEKPVRRSVRYAEMYRSQRPRGNQRNWNGHKSNQLGCNFLFNNKACFICGSFDHIQYSCPKHMAPRAVLMKTGLKSVNTARPVNTVRSVNTGRPFSTARSFNIVRPSSTARPKSTIHYARPMTYFQNQAQSTVHRPFYKRTALTNRCLNQRFNTGRPFRSTINTVRARGFNAVKPSACWIWRPIKPNGASLSNSQLNDKGFVDSGCSRHITGNITHLLNFKDFDRGYVTFGIGAYGGRITGKGTIKTNNLDFDDVYFVKELKFNLFSVSQMCDKKNYVLFTDSECLVLSPNFKLPDENQILLKIPRQDNMYSFDMKNIVPKDSLTCLVAKATSEESMLWHRRLGHINFKNINKLVKENLIRDLPFLGNARNKL